MGFNEGEVFRAVKVEAAVLKEFCSIAKEFSDNEELTGLKRIVDSINSHVGKLAQLIDSLESKPQETKATQEVAKAKPAIVKEVKGAPKP